MITPLRTSPPDLFKRLEAALPARDAVWLRAETKNGDSHKDFFRAACLLKKAGFTISDLGEVMRAKLAYYYKTVEEERELHEAWTNAAPGGEARQRARYPGTNSKLIAELTRGSSGALQRLSAASAVANPGCLPPGKVIDRLFPPDALLCLGHDKRRAVTRPRAFFTGSEDKFQFIVPNPMSARTGKTADGRDSVRCNGNVGPLMYQVIEFDNGTKDEQAALLLHLATHRVDNEPIDIRAVVFSGKKSLHGWFCVTGWAAEHLTKLRRYAAALGADRAMFTPCQFGRNPNAHRDDGAHQTVIFLK